jgi:hypothetical protein
VTAHQAIHGAVLKLKRAVSTVIEKHEDRRVHGGAAAPTSPDDTPEPG